MKTVKIKKISKEEWQTKILMLKADGQFDENSLNLLEIAAQNGAVAEFNDKQMKFLQSISLIEADLRDKAPEITSRILENQNIANNPSTPVHKRQDNYEEIGDPMAREPYSLEENSVGEIAYAAPNSDLYEIDATVRVEVSEQEKNKKQEQMQEKKFTPSSPEDVANMPPEEIKKMFYLTPERIIESMKRINNGKVWESLANASNDELKLQSAIISAYQSCVYPGDLTDPNFLDDRISQFLPKDNQAVHFKDLHMTALMGTYVGYHVEKNEGDINSLNADGTEKSGIAIVKFPTIVSEMPETLKEQTQKDLVNAITHRIEEIMNMSDSYKALTLLIPIENTMDKAILDYSDKLQDTEENKAIRAYIKSVRTDMSEKMKYGLDDLNVSMDLYGIDWNNPDTRKSVVAMIETLQGQGRENEVNKLVEEINMSFTVSSPSDIAAADAACADLAKLSSQGVQVNIAFELPPKEVKNEVLQQELNKMVNKYENISRDTSKETVNNTVNELIDMAVKSSLDTPKAEIAQPMNGIAPMIGGAVVGVNSLGQTMAQSMINSLSMSAISIDEIQQEIEDEEMTRSGMPTGGSEA